MQISTSPQTNAFRASKGQGHTNPASQPTVQDSYVSSSRPTDFLGWSAYNMEYAPGETIFGMVVNGGFGAVISGGAGLALAQLLPSGLAVPTMVAAATIGGLSGIACALGQPDEYGGGGGG